AIAVPEAGQPAPAYAAYFVSMNPRPQFVTRAMPVNGATHVYHRSSEIPMTWNWLHKLSFWPSAPVVAIVVSYGKLPVPTIVVGVVQLSFGGGGGGGAIVNVPVP